MTLLILGILLWYASHLLKRLAPGARAALGDQGGKMVVSLLSLAAIVLMVVGFRHADPVQIWSPPAFLRHLNNLLMLVALYLVTLGFVPGAVRPRLRHPMLGAVKTWAFAHLLVNGDLAGMVLFGSMLAWAVVDLILINRQEPDWRRPAPGPVRNDLIHVVLTLVLFVAVGHVHGWLGRWPFG